MAQDMTPTEYRDYLVNLQGQKDTFKYPSQKMRIPAATTGGMAGTAQYQLQIANDADFQIQALTGSYSYVDADGNHYRADSKANDDVYISILDGRVNRALTQGGAALENILSPGAIGNEINVLFPFNHIMLRNSFLRFEFTNNCDRICEVKLLFHGIKLY
jgi:hypothetical protein